MGRFICKICGYEADEAGRCPSCNIKLKGAEEAEIEEEVELAPRLPKKKKKK
jgi:uncharacterized protein with PIN domain